LAVLPPQDSDGFLAALAGGYGMVWVVALVLVLVAAAVFVPVKRVR